MDEWADFFMDRFGPMVTARKMLGERFAELRDRVVGIWTKANQSTDGRVRIPQEYLVSIIHL
jgi:hypothetical protein